MANIFGVNILEEVQGSIEKQKYQIKKYLGRTQNKLKVYISEYSEPENRLGSVQAVPKNEYSSLGLDFSKTYIKIFDCKEIKTLNRNGNSDQIIFNKGLYEAIPDLNCSLSSGWNSVLAVRVSDA